MNKLKVLEKISSFNFSKTKGIIGGSLLGGGVGAGLGALKNPGTDEFGNQKSRVKNILTGAGIGATAGGIGGGILGKKKLPSEATTHDITHYENKAHQQQIANVHDSSVTSIKKMTPEDLTEKRKNLLNKQMKMTKKAALLKVAGFIDTVGSIGKSYSAAAKAPFKPGMKMMNLKSNIGLAGNKISNAIGLKGKFSNILGYGAPVAAGLAVGGAALGAKKIFGKKEEKK